MPKQRSEDSILVSAARAMGATLGRVQRLTKAAAQQASARLRTSADVPSQKKKKNAASGLSRNTSATGQTRRPRPGRRAVPMLEKPDMAAAQAGASRSPRQTESSRRGKSRSKRSKSRPASRRR